MPADAGPDRSLLLRPDRATVFAAAIWFFGAAPLAASKPWLAWLVVPPLLLGAWALRARVVADRERLVVSNGLRSRTIPWPEVAEFDVPRRGPVTLVTTSDERVRLTAARRQQLPLLLETSRRG